MLSRKLSGPTHESMSFLVVSEILHIYSASKVAITYILQTTVAWNRVRHCIDSVSIVFLQAFVLGHCFHLQESSSMVPLDLYFLFELIPTPSAWWKKRHKLVGNRWPPPPPSEESTCEVLLLSFDEGHHMHTQPHCYCSTSSEHAAPSFWMVHAFFSSIIFEVQFNRAENTGTQHEHPPTTNTKHHCILTYGSAQSLQSYLHNSNCMPNDASHPLAHKAWPTWWGGGGS